MASEKPGDTDTPDLPDSFFSGRAPAGPLGDDRLRLLEEFAEALRESSGLAETIQSGLRHLVPEFADWAVMLVRRDGQDWLKLHHRNPAEVDRMLALVRPVLPAIHRVAARDWNTGRQFRWIPKLGPAMLRFLAQEPALRAILNVLQTRSLVVLPLRSTEGIIGGIAFGRVEENLPFHAAELAFAQVVARRLAGAVEHGWLQELASDEQSRRKRLENALQKWTRVFDLAGWGAAIIDGADQRIEVVNPAFARIHGYPDPDTLMGRLYSDLLTDERSSEPARWDLQRLPRMEPYESIHLRPDGSVFPVLTDVTPMEVEGGSTAYVVTVQDLSELKRAEERLRRAQRLEAVGRLAGGVAHEVNNMMTIILGFSDLLSRAENFPLDRQRDLDEISRAAGRAGKITQQLLAFSRQQILQPAVLAINDAIAELVPVLRLLLPANIELETSLATLSPSANADRAQLDQVIINLAFNGRDAMTDGGTLRLMTESRWLIPEDGHRLIGIPIPAGQYALISVVDTGCGMDPATLQQVFEPFFTTKPVGSGTGLGLATVYGIVKQSGGYVWVESSPGTGTTVTVCLPQVEREAAATTKVPATEPPAERRQGTVLIVEDEPGVRELAHRVLEEQGHRVLDAQDGNDALARLNEYGPELDLVLSDVVIPGISASELERRVRGLRPDLPILYMSGYAREEMLGRGLINPRHSFLQKPFTAEELSELVGRELEREAHSRGGQVAT